MNPADVITSPANPRVRQAASLRAAAARRATGLTLVDGRRELARAAAAGIEIVEAFVDAQRLAAVDDQGTPLGEWIDSLAARGTRIATVSERAFERVAFGGRNEGVVGVVRFGPRPLAEVAFAAARPVFVIEGVEKPGNLGAILRTADATGMAGVIVSDARTDVANPAVIRASLGTVFSVPLATASTPEAIAWCGGAGRKVIAATPAGTRLWHEADLHGPVTIVLGSEAAGLSPAWEEAATAGRFGFETVRLPMHGSADSLNLAATAAVLAYEALRRK